MIILEITVCLDGSRILKSVNASGHAGEAVSGNNITCAAATVLLRTAYRTLLLPDFETDTVISAPGEGQLYFEIEKYSSNQIDRLRGITDYLITGLKDLAAEYPEEIKLQEKSADEKPEKSRSR
ncbi:MAG: ribosomal-processing cysteine protease Prp [Spirochaetales bacterium]|nr:ribosomal-processing cysteine protease Prp [Spirochaetales bacterium]